MSTVQNVQESLKGLSVEELLAVIAAAAAEAKKAAKVAVKAAPKVAKEKKGSMPKGVLPKQLQESFAYVDYTLAQANANGWKEFAVKGQDVPMEASVERDGAHVFPSTGKPLNRKQAMSLSKFLWSNKEQKGTNQAFYDAFKAQYVPPAAATHATEVVQPAVAESPKKAKEEKAPKAKKAPKKAEDAVAAVAAAAPVEALIAPPKKVTAPKKVAKKEEKDTFKCEDDGEVHPWDWKGKKLLRNFQNQVWARTDEGEAGDWFGVYDVQTNTIDASAEEPVFEDE